MKMRAKRFPAVSSCGCSLLLVGGLLLFVIGCGKAALPETAFSTSTIIPLAADIAARSFFPTEKNRTLVYERGDARMGAYRIANHGDPDKCELFILRSHSHASRVQYEWRDGYLIVSSKSDSKQFSEKVLKENILPGDEWVTGHGNAHIRVLGTANVRVPAGRFRGCLAVARLDVDEEGEERELSRSFYAPGVGLILETGDNAPFRLVKVIEGKKFVLAPKSPAEAILLVKNHEEQMNPVYWHTGRGMNLVSGTSSNVTVVSQDDGYELVFWIGWGDCPAGCIQNRYYYYSVTTEGDVVTRGVFGDKLDESGSEGKPLWGIPRYANEESTSDSEKLKAYLSSDRWWLRQYALTHFGRHRDVVWRPSFRKALQDRHARVRLAAVVAIGALGETQDLESLVDLLDDSDTRVVRTALAYLGDSENPRILARIAPLVGAKDSQVVNAAISTLCTARYMPALDTITNAILDFDYDYPNGNDDRWTRLLSLADWAPAEAAPTFIRILDLRDQAYEESFLSNQHPGVSYFNMEYSWMYESAVKGLSRISGLPASEVSSSYTPKDRERLAAYWKKWWARKGPIVLARARKSMTPEEIRATLSDVHNPRVHLALAHLYTACRTDPTISMGYLDRLVLLSPKERYKRWDRHIVKICRLGGKNALRGLVNLAMEADYSAADGALAILAKLDTPASWRAMLTLRPTGSKIWKSLLERSTAFFNQKPEYLPVRYSRQWGSLRADYRRLIEYAIAKGPVDIFAAAVKAAEKQDLNALLPIIKARKDQIIIPNFTKQAVDHSIQFLSMQLPERNLRRALRARDDKPIIAAIRGDDIRLAKLAVDLTKHSASEAVKKAQAEFIVAHPTGENLKRWAYLVDISALNPEGQRRFRVAIARNAPYRLTTLPGPDPQRDEPESETMARALREARRLIASVNPDDRIIAVGLAARGLLPDQDARFILVKALGDESHELRHFALRRLATMAGAQRSQIPVETILSLSEQQKGCRRPGRRHHSQPLRWARKGYSISAKVGIGAEWRTREDRFVHSCQIHRPKRHYCALYAWPGGKRG